MEGLGEGFIQAGWVLFITCLTGHFVLTWPGLISGSFMWVVIPRVADNGSSTDTGIFGLGFHYSRFR